MGTDELPGVVIERGVPMAARDGVELVSDVFRPVEGHRSPTLVVRTPYGRQVPQSSALRDAEFFAQHGYVVVLQDTRGRGDSSGTFYPFLTEGRDTYDTIEWAATLPWSNGDVGTVGQSYMAIVQYLAAPLQPPHLRCMIPLAGPLDMFDHCVYRHGAFELEWMLNYFTGLETVTYARHGRQDDVDRLATYRAPAGGLTAESYAHLPLSDWGDRLCGDEPYVRDMLAHGTDGPYWWAMSALADIDRITVPVFNISSWYDVFLDASLILHDRLSRDRSATSLPHRLLVGPWGHLGSPRPYSVPTTGGAGDYDFGPAAAVALHEVQLDWLDHVMKGHPPRYDQPVRLFTIGRNEWRDEAAWPPANARPVAMYLHSEGHANGREGDGTLSTRVAAGAEPADHYTYDPADPTPTAGGIIGGVQDQRLVEARNDVLVYSSDELDRPLEITGPVHVELYASTTAHDTDFTAKLVDVRPDGYAHNVADGIVRARFRASMSDPQPVQPGQVNMYRIDLRGISFEFGAGHRVRVEISSSNFPRFDRNLNTWPSSVDQTTMAVADQTVHHSGTHPSALHVHVVDADA